MISRRALAHALPMKTASLARAERRGNGLRPIHISKTLVCYTEENVAAYLAARGLAWTGSTVRPIEDEKADAGAPVSTLEAARARHRAGVA